MALMRAPIMRMHNIGARTSASVMPVSVDCASASLVYMKWTMARVESHELARQSSSILQFYTFYTSAQLTQTLSAGSHRTARRWKSTTSKVKRNTTDLEFELE